MIIIYKNILCGIYCIENKTTGKKYVGQSRNIYARFKQHKNELRKHSHDNDYLQKAWDKYGENDFLFYILEECDLYDLDNKERFYIDKLNTLNRSNGYNLKDGGQEYGGRYTKEASEHLSKSIKQSYENSNLREQRKNDALKQWANPLIKQKITGVNNGMYGKHHTEDAKKKNE